MRDEGTVTCPRCKTQIHTADTSFRLSEENAKLRDQLATFRMTYDQWKNRAEAAEAKLKAASEQDPVAWMNPHGGVLRSLVTGLERNTYTMALYAAPILPADVQELQERISYLESYIEGQNDSFAQMMNERAELERKLAEQQAVFQKVAEIAGHNLEAQAKEELNTLICKAREEGRKEAENELATARHNLKGVEAMCEMQMAINRKLRTQLEAANGAS